MNWTTSTTYYKCGNCDKVYYDSHVKNDGYVKFCPNNQCEKEFGRKLSSLYDGTSRQASFSLRSSYMELLVSSRTLILILQVGLCVVCQGVVRRAI